METSAIPSHRQELSDIWLQWKNFWGKGSREAGESGEDQGPINLFWEKRVWAYVQRALGKIHPHMKATRLGNVYFKRERLFVLLSYFAVLTAMHAEQARK